MTDIPSPPAPWRRREFPGIPESLAALWTRRDDDGCWHYGLQLQAGHANAQGFVHGGVLMTFMDHALSLLVWEASGRATCSTVQLDSHFLEAVRPPAFVELDAEILRQGRSMMFVRGTLRMDDSDIMQATGVWRIS
jgi:acyl-coenzyme A thioesterase PaaI-like protein